MTRLLLLGDYSGRNTGHNAHLLSVCHELQQGIGQCELLVPTLAPRPIRSLCQPFDNIKPFGVAPWHGSIKFFGPAMLAALKRSQALILADNMFYDNHLYHPLKNNLIALLWLVRAAKKHKVPVIYFNAGVGPARHERGRSIIRRLAPQMDLILLRDRESADLLIQLTGVRDGRISADSGFNMPWRALGPMTDKMTEYPAANRGQSDLIGINLSRHLQHWLEHGNGSGSLQHIAAAFTAAAARTNRRLIFIVAHPSDLDIARQVTAGIKGCAFDIWQEDGFLVQRIARDIDRFACLLGTRYHEIVLFASAGVPVLGLDCGEKLDGLFDTMHCSENLLATASLGNSNGVDFLNDAIEKALSGSSTFSDTIRRLAARGREGAAAVQQLITARDQQQ